MSADNKLQANRRNAARSTGPRSAVGKRRAARNARRHGLAVPVFIDPAWADQIAGLTQAIAGGNAPPDVEELATRVAVAHLELLRVRQAKRHVISQLLADPDFEPAFQTRKRTLIAGMHDLPRASRERLLTALRQKPTGAEKHALVLSELSSQLDTFERYERRAFSRRSRAIREFDLGRVSSCG